MRIYLTIILAGLVGCGCQDTGQSDQLSQPIAKVPSTQKPPAPVSPTNRAQDCKPYAELARSIMESRQAGVPMTKVMDIISEQAELSPSSQRLAMLAYEAPAYSTERHQQREITEFENSAYLECLRGSARRY